MAVTGISVTRVSKVFANYSRLQIALRYFNFKQIPRGLCLSRRFFTQNSVSEEEIAKFSKLAPRWWDKNGEIKALHSMNRIRVPFIRDNLLLQGHGVPHSSKPLQGISILDVGCGAGILSESLARLGATVVGIDPSEDAIGAAKVHRGDDSDLSTLQYLDSPLEDVAAVGSLEYNAVVASEVIEHSADPNQFVHLCASVLKPGGSLFISTINRTALSYLMAIIVAEYLLGIVPRNTHDWNKFITVNEITHMLVQNDCHLRKVLGIQYNPVLDRWSWSNHHDVSYILHAVKFSANPDC